jgi:hypothetical protein
MILHVYKIIKILKLQKHFVCFKNSKMYSKIISKLNFHQKKQTQKQKKYNRLITV